MSKLTSLIRLFKMRFSSKYSAYLLIVPNDPFLTSNPFHTLPKKFPWTNRNTTTIFKVPKNRAHRDITPLPQHSVWPKMVKFYEKSHFIAWLQPKTYKNWKITSLCFAPQFSKFFKCQNRHDNLTTLNCEYLQNIHYTS